jgi:hypothetical protein
MDDERGSVVDFLVDDTLVVGMVWNEWDDAMGGRDADVWLEWWCDFLDTNRTTSISPTPTLRSRYRLSTNQMSTFSTQPVVIDGKGHLLGRLASIIAKQVSQLSWTETGSIRQVPALYGHVGNWGLYKTRWPSRTSCRLFAKRSVLDDNGSEEILFIVKVYQS